MSPGQSSHVMTSKPVSLYYQVMMNIIKGKSRANKREVKWWSSAQHEMYNQVEDKRRKNVTELAPLYRLHIEVPTWIWRCTYLWRFSWPSTGPTEDPRSHKSLHKIGLTLSDPESQISHPKTIKKLVYFTNSRNPSKISGNLPEQFQNSENAPKGANPRRNLPATLKC